MTSSLVKQSLFCVVTLLAVSLGDRSQAADSRYWTLTPYRVSVLVVAETHTISSLACAERVAQHIMERSDAAIGPIWKLSVESPTGDQRLSQLRGFDDRELLDLVNATPKDQAAAETPAVADDSEPLPQAKREDRRPDKLMVVTVRESTTGFMVTGREVDRLLRRVGPPQSTTAPDLLNVGEAAFGLLCDLFSPIAAFEVDRESGEKVTLSLRGSQLPTRVGSPKWIKPNDILLPILRRTNREGVVVEDGIQAAPWTYFLVAGEADENGLYQADIYSHTRRPFGVRRRGRVEYYGVLLHPRGVDSQVYLHAKEKPDQPLSGYQAFVQDGDNDKREPLGVTDVNGRIKIPTGESPLQIVYIKSGSQVVAKAPVPAGAVDEVVIPLLDERVRLEAEAKLSLLKEELIDLVARRSILASRIENAIEGGDRKKAEDLLRKLEAMEGRAQFNQKLVRAQQQAKSTDPTVQQRIDKLFRETSAVLGAFLTTDQVRELRSKLARRGS